MTTTDAPGPRIAAAQRAASTLVDALPANTQLGLVTYGTGTGSTDAEKAAGCQDVSTLINLGMMDRGQAHQRIDSLRPSGYTPISLALQRVAALLPADGKQAVVLVSDGEDTCGTPPAQADFPDVAAQGSTQVVWRNCDFGFVDGVLTSIAPADGGRTVDGVGPACPPVRPRRCGTPVTATDNKDGTSTAVYAADQSAASATVHDKEAAVIQITTPSGTKTDRGVGDGLTTTQVIAAYSRDHAVKQDSTQAGAAIYVTTGDPSRVGFGNPGGLIGFAIKGNTVGPPVVGGIPGFEYCSG